MNADRYQELAARTIAPGLTPAQLEDMTLMGLIGEVGELTEPFKKARFHSKPLDSGSIVYEAGDVLWYVALAATKDQTPLSTYIGASDFSEFDNVAERSLAEVEDRTEAVSSPGLFFVLAQSITGQASVAKALAALAIILQPFGGLANAARLNIRKLEARRGIETADLDIVPTTTPGGNE